MDRLTKGVEPAPRREWTPAEARALLEQWVASGLSIPVFAVQRGLAPDRLYRWRRRLGMGRVGRTAAKPAVRVLPVRIETAAPRTAAVPATATTTAPSDAPRAGFELAWRDGRVLRIPPDFDAGALRALLAALESAPC